MAAGVLRLLVEQDPGRGGHRPGLVARLVGEDHAVARLRFPVGVGGGGLEGVRGRRDRLAGLVDHVGVGELVLLGVGILDVADRALGLGDVVGDAFVALGADADRPLTAVLAPTLVFQSGLTSAR